MTDELDTLKAAMKAITPAPDAGVKDTTLRLALDNFDRLQGSFAPPRPTDDRPVKAGFVSGVFQMIRHFTTRQMLAGTASAAAVVVGIVALGPQLLRGPQVVATAPADNTASAAVAAGRALTGDADADAVTQADEGRVHANTPPTPLAPAEQSSEPGAKVPGDVTGETPETGGLADATPALPEADLRLGITADGEQPGDMAFLAPAAPEALAHTRTIASDGVIAGDDAQMAPVENTESFPESTPNPVKLTVDEPVSTFAIDVDTASYAVIRQSLNAGQLPPADAVRIEEMVNYFPYAYPAPPPDAAPFQPMVTVMPTPWNFGTRLVHIALQGALPAIADRPALNLVFLIDTSGSMDEPAKLPLLRQSLALMLGELGPTDQVAIVSYAGSAGTVLEPVAGTDTAAILAALDRLAAGGSTAGAEGLALAYQVAATMAGDGEVSRVLLATDGDFNVGISDPEGLEAYVARQRATGVYLSVLGFGRGNLDDAIMQTLAQNGNGTAAYIDTLHEARKVLVDQLTGALFPIANDVKVQIEWNPAEVAEYRLIGYETRALRREDFNNDRVDAGEIGAGHTVTAIYEVTAPGSDALLNDPLRYDAAPAAEGAGELGFLRLRYKTPGASASQLIEVPIVPDDTAPADDVRFAFAMAGFGQLLTGATYLGDWGWDDAIALANGARGDDPYGYRTEAVNLMRLAKSLTR